MDKVATEKVRNSPEFKKLLDPERLKTHTFNAGMEEYLKFINTDISGKKVSLILGNKYSIFVQNNALDPAINLPPTMDPAIFR